VKFSLRKLIFEATAWGLLALFPASLWARPAQATVQAQGNVTVNGTKVDNTTTIFAGDKVQTADNSMANIAAQGTMVQLSPNSSAIFSDKALDLGCGSALVTTSLGQVVRVAGVTITPAAQGTTKFEVSQGAGALKISAKEGSVIVDDGAKHTVEAGKSMTLQRGGGACGPLTAAPQASTKIYIPAIAVAAGSAVLAYCSVNGFCSESSPSGP
jgi:hypothetical protein